VRDEHGLDMTLCGEALDILEAALFGAQLRCRICGKELQAGWALCPFCGAGKRFPRGKLNAPLQQCRRLKRRPPTGAGYTAQAGFLSGVYSSKL
jgi:hypothetical protein